MRLRPAACLQVEPSLAESLAEKTRLLKWLLGRLKPKEFDANKQYASEVLAILVQVGTGRTWERCSVRPGSGRAGG